MRTRSVFRQVLSLMVVGGFGWAYYVDPTDPTLRSTLTNAFVGIIAYWVGSSQGAQENRDKMNAHADRLIEAVGGKGATNGQS